MMRGDNTFRGRRGVGIARHCSSAERESFVYPDALLPRGLRSVRKRLLHCLSSKYAIRFLVWVGIIEGRFSLWRYLRAIQPKVAILVENF